MAFWLHLVPKLRRRDNFQPVFHAPDVNSTESGQVPDDATMTQVAMETASATKPAGVFPWSAADDGSARTSSRPDQLETSDDGLQRMESAPVSASGVGSRLLLATLAVGGTLLLVNCLVFVGMLCQRWRRISKMATTKPVPPITYVDAGKGLSHRAPPHPV